jgi:hypothetical protein
MALLALVRGSVLALVLLAVAVGAARAQTASTDVDIELVLAVDVSMSMDPEEQRLQRDGYIAAFKDPLILKAIQSGPHGKIAVTYFEWAGPEIQQLLIPWRIIDGPKTANAFIAELSEKPYSRFRMTSISSALEYADRLFGSGAVKGVRRVIDVSGDGANNSGGPIVPVRDRIVKNGTVINGLPIILRPTMTYSSWDIPDLDKYYANCVIGGPGSFMVPITTRDEFASATRQKLLLEISGLMNPEKPRIVPVQMRGSDEGPQASSPQPPGTYDCTGVERYRRW